MLTITIDANEVTLEGTTKGDEIEAKARQGTAWRWSGRARAYVLPRNLTTATRTRNINAVKAALEAAGRDVTIEDTGRTMSVSETRAAAAERLEDRADRLEDRAERAARERDARWAAADATSEAIPFGQPILVGHHSEGRHRRDIERIQRDTERGLEAHQVAESTAARAANIRARLDKGESLGTLQRRIARLEAELRDVERHRDGTGKSLYGTHQPATGDYRDRLNTEAARLTEEIDLDRAALAQREADGAKVWSKADFVKGDEVGYWGGWAPVVRVNAKSVTVKSQYGWNETVTYDQVKLRRRDGVITKS